MIFRITIALGGDDTSIANRIQVYFLQLPVTLCGIMFLCLLRLWESGTATLYLNRVYCEKLANYSSTMYMYALVPSAMAL